MEVQALFPTPVVKFDLGRQFNIKELNYFNNLLYVPNLGNSSTSNSYVLNDKALKDIKVFIEDCVKKVVDEVYLYNEKSNFCITQSWLNKTSHGQHHHKHNHSNSVLSGCLYIKTVDGRDKIEFHKDGYEQIKIGSKGYNAFNSNSWWIPIKTGQLIIFPSYLSHTVPVISGEEDRISLAFNAFPLGTIGDPALLTELKLR
jgi:uncharacterized protein (TIGR02466 family)